MKVYQIPEQLAQAIATYLGTKPFNEVSSLLAALNATARAVEIADAQPEVPVNDANKAGT